MRLLADLGGSVIESHRGLRETKCLLEVDLQAVGFLEPAGTGESAERIAERG